MSKNKSSTLQGLAGAMYSGNVEVVDLTHTLDSDFPVIVLPPEFGQCAPFRAEVVSRYDDRGPAWYWQNISMCEHTGTHFDAPIHWISGKDLPNASVDAIPADAFVRPVCVIDCSNWVLMRSDWSKRSGAEYLNMREDGAHSPGPTGDAVEFLVERDIAGFGTETVGTDAGQGAHLSPPYPAHQLFHGAGKYGLQCLRNLDQLPATGAILVCPPLKIKNGSGSPLRVLALVERKLA
jgi:kynurenine formamidase